MSYIEEALKDIAAKFGARVIDVTDILNGTENSEEPPEEFRKIAESVFSSMKGKRSMADGLKNLLTNEDGSCKNCGKVHEWVEKNTETEFQSSTGFARNYKFAPRPISAIQLLEHNFPEVLEFLYENRVPFMFDGNSYDDTEARIGQHLHILEDDGDDPMSLHFGDWVVVEYKRGHQKFAYDVYADSAFRREFQEELEDLDVEPVKKPENLFDPDADMTGAYPVVPEGADTVLEGPDQVIRQYGSDWADEARDEALKAAGETDQ